MKKLIDLLQPQNGRVNSLNEIEDLKVLKSFMAANSCINEGCYIRAKHMGEIIFLSCLTELGLVYYGFDLITQTDFEEEKKR